MADPLAIADDDKKNTAGEDRDNTGRPSSGTTTAAQSGTAAASPASTSNPLPGARLSNPLSLFASYTYQLSLYMITPDAYDLFTASGRKDINADGKGGAYLLVQSGGINTTSTETVRRAPGFELDYFIDDLKITTSTSAASSGTATNTTEMSFSIYEPYGFSFMTKLKNATEALQKYSNLPNFKDIKNPGRQFFILGIRFLGYDINGKILTGQENIDGTILDKFGTDNGVLETFYEILISSMQFKVDGKGSNYSVKAQTLQPQMAFGLKRGLLATGASVTAETVEQALTGGSAYVSTSTGSESTTAAIPGTNVLGILTKLNREQEKLLKDGDITYANVYKLAWLGNADTIKNASLLTKADMDKRKLPMVPLANTSQVSAAAVKNIPPDITKKLLKFNTATPVIQAISQIIAQSSYLENALTKVYTDAETTGPDAELLRKNSQTIAWYNLSARVKCLAWDPKVNDFAVEITYVIQPYLTPVVTSSYVNKVSKYYGPHKRYEYWYTGKNSEILSYEQTLNHAYLLPALDPSVKGAVTNFADVATVLQLRTGGNKLGAINNGLEAQNSYITSLSDPTAWATAKINIMGDPDYLIQDSPGSINEAYKQFYGPGFSINPNGGQVFIEINFREAVDYNDTTGLMDLNENIIFWKYPKELNIKGVSYQLISVKSSFSKGKFTQDLDCRINTTFANTAESATGRGKPGEDNMARAGATAGNSQTTITPTGGSNSSSLKKDPAPAAPAEVISVEAAPAFNAAKDSQTANDDSTSDRLSGITVRNGQVFDAENGRETDESSIVGVR